MPVKHGDTVKVEYVGTLDDGTVFDSSDQHHHLLEFEVGSHKVIAGFEKGVLGMEVGQEKKVVIPPAEAYGERKPEMLKKVPRTVLPPEQEPKVGMNIVMRLSSGENFPVTISAVAEKEITIDLNHPLAGKRLHFKIKVVGIEGKKID